jgi:prolipoprotein diacylglyceryltransferase
VLEISGKIRLSHDVNSVLWKVGELQVEFYPLVYETGLYIGQDFFCPFVGSHGVIDE